MLVVKIRRNSTSSGNDNCQKSMKNRRAAGMLALLAQNLMKIDEKWGCWLRKFDEIEEKREFWFYRNMKIDLKWKNASLPKIGENRRAAGSSSPKFDKNRRGKWSMLVTEEIQ